MAEKTVEKKAIVEAVLYMYGKDVTYKKLAEIVAVDVDEVKEIVKNLVQGYDEREHSGLRILVKDNVVQLVTHPDVAEVIEQMTKKELEGPLTPVAMEVLSIIAYRGPINKIDIEAIRGVNCSFTLRNLVRRGLIERVAVDESKRLHAYNITVDFLRILGVKSVDELPEFEELAKDKRIDAILYSDQETEE